MTTAVKSFSQPHSVAHAGPVRRSLSSRADQLLSRTPVYRPLTYATNAQNSKDRSLGASNQEPLISDSTVAQVREHIDCLVKALSARTRASEIVELARPQTNSSAVDGVLSIPPLIYREYAAEYKELARNAADVRQRTIYLKMANTWTFAAIRFEAGLKAKTPDPNQPERG